MKCPITNVDVTGRPGITLPSELLLPNHVPSLKQLPVDLMLQLNPVAKCVVGSIAGLCPMECTDDYDVYALFGRNAKSWFASCTRKKLTDWTTRDIVHVLPAPRYKIEYEPIHNVRASLPQLVERTRWVQPWMRTLAIDKSQFANTIYFTEDPRWCGITNSRFTNKKCPIFVLSKARLVTWAAAYRHDTREVTQQMLHCDRYRCAIAFAVNTALTRQKRISNCAAKFTAYGALFGSVQNAILGALIHERGCSGTSCTYLAMVHMRQWISKFFEPCAEIEPLPGGFVTGVDFYNWTAKVILQLARDVLRNAPDLGLIHKLSCVAGNDRNLQLSHAEVHQALTEICDFLSAQI